MSSPDAKTAALTAPDVGHSEAPSDHHPTDRRIADRVRARLFTEPSPKPRLARFTVLEEIGRGGMGTVYAAYDPKLDRKVAVKVLREDDLPDKEDRLRFIREAQALARLSHPHVVMVHEVGETDGELFLAMEFIHGQDLAHWLTTDPGWRAALEAFIQAGEGLAAVHHAGLVHRDLKPHNIMRRTDGVVKLLDFGLAREIGDDLAPSIDGDQGQNDGSSETSGSPPSVSSSLTRPGTVMGTPAYMSPEQMVGGDVDARSDQFSFSVALYEALYGERPFQGETMNAQLAAMESGRIRAAPKDRLVPASLRTMLVRGLSTEPAARWPSMDAMLEQLRAVVTPRRRRWWGVGAVAVLGLGLGGLALAYRADVEQRCTGATAQLDGVWDDARRQAVEAAITGTELPYAAATWTLVGARLDAYSDAWTDKHTEICEATSVRHEQSEAIMELRMRCLATRRTALRASVDVLTKADAEVVENAVELAASLPALTSCDDSAWLEQQAQAMPPPDDPATAAEVEAQRERLAEIEAKIKAGRYDLLDEIEQIVQRARELDYPPLEAEALSWRGELLESAGRYDEAEQDLREAYVLAVRNRHDQIALDTAQSLTHLVGNLRARHTEGRQWGEMEALPLAQRSGDPTEVAVSLRNLSSVYFAQGEYGEARTLCARALALVEEVREPDDPYVAMAVTCMGHASLRQGKYDDAREYYERTLKLTEQLQGSDHPEMAGALSNLANVSVEQRRLGEAESYFQRALAISERAHGADHHGVANIVNGLGNVYVDQRKLEEGKALFRRVLSMRRRTLGPGHPKVAQALNNLANVLGRQGKYAETKVLLEEALTILEEALGPDHPSIPYVLNNLGLTHQNLGEHDVAQQLLERAVELRTQEQGPEHPLVISSLDNLGDLEESRGQLADAQAYYERTLELREQSLGVGHLDVAISLDRLGRVLVGQGRCEDALAHHQRALEIQRATLGPDHPDVAGGLIGLGSVSECLGRPEEAKGYYERALAIRREAHGDEHVDVADAMLGLATVSLALGDRSAALEHAERAVSIHEAAADSPQRLASARMVLAQVLWVTRPARARALAEQVRGVLVESLAPGKSDAGLDEVDAWLEEHLIQ